MSERQILLLEFLSRPFDDGLVRSHSLKLEGKPDRFALLAVQPNLYAAWKRYEREGERLCD